MRTNTAEGAKVHDSEENSKNVRMSLHVLQHAATDKENLVGPGRSVGSVPDKTKSNVDNEKKINENKVKTFAKKKKTKSSVGESSKKIVDANDLTNEEPSEGYWKQLAVKRRLALEEALAENDELCQKVAILEQESAFNKEMLNEARALIEVLNEIIDGQGNVEDSVNSDSVEAVSSTDNVDATEDEN